VSSAAQTDSSLVIPPTSTNYESNSWYQSHYVKESVVPVSLALASGVIMAIPNAKETLQVKLNWNNQRSMDYIDLGDDYLRYAPAIGAYALSICGLKSKHRFINRSVILTMAYISSDFVVHNLKTITKEARPDNQAFNSFPSQHTAIAFIAATFLDHELGYISPWISVGGYLTASYVAYLRVARNAHWVNDVLMGAAVGMIMTHATYWAYDGLMKYLPKNLSIAPVIDTRQSGVYLSCLF
jgi:membrane-associated phospholipid phosphatase